MIDTGSDSTCVHGQAAYKLQHKMLAKNISEATGIGGNRPYYTETATIIFWDTDGVPFETIGGIELNVQKLSDADVSNPDIFGLPSLLGRDIIRRGRFVYDGAKNDTILCFPKSSAKLPSIDP
jgi:hypothetical protein